jgi:two-component system chemotaxis sensor kinase CheA
LTDVGTPGSRSNTLPEELLLDQLPRRMTRGDRTLRLAYTPIAAEGGAAPQLLIVMTDVTEQLARERMERDTQEMVRIFQRTNHDRAGVQQFFAEAAELVRQATEPTKTTIEHDLRIVHTLKGNCRQFGLESMAALCRSRTTSAVRASISTNRICRRCSTSSGRARPTRS